MSQTITPSFNIRNYFGSKIYIRGAEYQGITRVHQNNLKASIQKFVFTLVQSAYYLIKANPFNVNEVLCARGTKRVRVIK